MHSQERSQLIEQELIIHQGRATTRHACCGAVTEADARHVAVQRLAMKEASPLYRKLSEEEKARYVQLAEGASFTSDAIKLCFAQTCCWIFKHFASGAQLRVRVNQGTPP